MRLVIGAAQFRGNTARDLVPVACEHCYSLDAQREEVFYRFLGFGPGFILKADPAYAIVIQSDEKRAETLLLVQRRVSNI